mmetsp:Transcript_75172/g.125347  ORF Transcript_75172/g.125347 Transcript_75172/m.125347 type:complete len:145 (-) Transcript_75172:37-471(-)
MHGSVSSAAAAALAGGGAFAAAMTALQGRFVLRAAKLDLLSDRGLDLCFERTHVTSVTDGDEYAYSLWRRVRPQVCIALTTLKLEEISRVAKSDITALNVIIDDQVPSFRRRAGETRCALSHTRASPNSDDVSSRNVKGHGHAE